MNLPKFGIYDLHLGVSKKFMFQSAHVYYDGYNHCIQVGWVYFCWWGAPHYENDNNWEN